MSEPRVWYCWRLQLLCCWNTDNIHSVIFHLAGITLFFFYLAEAHKSADLVWRAAAAQSEGCHDSAATITPRVTTIADPTFAKWRTMLKSQTCHPTNFATLIPTLQTKKNLFGKVSKGRKKSSKKKKTTTQQQQQRLKTNTTPAASSKTPDSWRALRKIRAAENNRRRELGWLISVKLARQVTCGRRDGRGQGGGVSLMQVTLQEWNECSACVCFTVSSLILY